MSTDIAAVAVFDESGALVASGPGVVSAGVGEAAARLWEAAAGQASHLGSAGLEHLVVSLGDGSVAVVEAQAHRAVAVTGPRPAVALLLFDLRTCLNDGFSVTGESR